jgi:hypothetical protein
MLRTPPLVVWTRSVSRGAVTSRGARSVVYQHGPSGPGNPTPALRGWWAWLESTIARTPLSTPSSPDIQDRQNIIDMDVDNKWCCSPRGSITYMLADIWEEGNPGKERGGVITLTR